jgi:hypothetical protein
VTVILFWVVRVLVVLVWVCAAYQSVLPTRSYEVGIYATLLLYCLPLLLIGFYLSVYREGLLCAALRSNPSTVALSKLMCALCMNGYG